MFKTSLVVLLLMVGVGAAQEAPSISQHYKPGDTLHYYVRFDGDPKLDHVGVQFLHQGEARKDQEGLQPAFDVAQMTLVSTGVYEVNGSIPNVKSGAYILQYVFANHGQQSHTYQYGDAFKDKITIEVVNETGFEFPSIKSVSPNPSH